MCESSQTFESESNRQADHHPFKVWLGIFFFTTNKCVRTLYSSPRLAATELQNEKLRSFNR